METLEPTILQDLLDKHQLWAKDDPHGKRLELRQVSLAGATLPGADFSRALLVDVDFSGAELRDAGFTGAQLERVLFCEASLANTSFLEATLTGCSFERARSAAALDQAAVLGDDEASAPDFQKAQLNNVNFSDSILRGAVFSDARLQIVVFDRADLRRADFVGSQVTDSSFAGAQLGECVLAKASLRNVSLRAANLHHARLRRLTCRGRCDLSSADLSGADLLQASFELLDLRAANIEDAKLSKTSIRSAYVHDTRGLPFVYEAASEPDLDFSEQADASDRGDVLRLARQLGDSSGRARFGAGVDAASYRCRALGPQQYAIEPAQPRAATSQEAIRVLHVYTTEEEGLRTLKVEYKLVDQRFRGWDELAHELIFELVLSGQLRDQHRRSSDAILYVNVDGGTRMTDYG